MTEKEIDKLVETAFRKWFDGIFETSGVSSTQLKTYQDCFRRGCMFGVIMMNEVQKMKKMNDKNKKDQQE